MPIASFHKISVRVSQRQGTLNFHIFTTLSLSLTLHIGALEMMHGSKDGGIQVTEITNQYKASLSHTIVNLPHDTGPVWNLDGILLI